MKDIKDYLPYYLGCDYWTNNSSGKLSAYTLPNVIDMCDRGKGIQLHLRRLSDMTLEERNHLHSIDDHAWFELNQGYMPIGYMLPSSFHYLLKQGFDLFGLIDAGLAIDVKTTTP